MIDGQGEMRVVLTPSMCHFNANACSLAYWRLNRGVDEVGWPFGFPRSLSFNFSLFSLSFFSSSFLFPRVWGWNSLKVLLRFWWALISTL